MRTEQELSIFEKKIPQKIFDLNKPADDSWRIKTNKGFDKLIKGKKYIVREIKSRRIAGLGHLQRMEKHRRNKKITDWQPISFRL
jgi:hypothetical protein